MLSQAIPSEDRLIGPSPASASAISQSTWRIARCVGVGLSLGPLPLPLHQSLRRQGADFGAGAVSRRAGEGRFRGNLRPSLARRAGARLRRRASAARDQRIARVDAALFARARGFRDRLARRERDASRRFGGADRVERAASLDVGRYGRGGLRRPWPQVSDLGAESVRGASRGGQSSSAAIAGRLRRAAGAAAAMGARE